jgi:ribosomal protein S18 acetylase RimI-like enzyme
LADLNLIEYWCESAKWIPGTEIWEKQDTIYLCSALDFPACSLAFNLATDEHEPPDVYMARAKGFFSGRRKMFSLLLREHGDKAIIQYCKENKLFMVNQAPGMALDAPVEIAAVPAGAELRWAENAEAIQDFKQVVVEAYKDLAFPREVSEGYFAHPERVISPQTVIAVVYLEGEPVCTAMAMLSHGIAGVYWVGTLKKARGRGLAEYCTREVSNTAFELGARKVILQASPFGRPIYLKMGYREITRYPWFMCASK